MENRWILSQEKITIEVGFTCQNVIRRRCRIQWKLSRVNVPSLIIISRTLYTYSVLRFLSPLNIPGRISFSRFWNRINSSRWVNPWKDASSTSTISFWRRSLSRKWRKRDESQEWNALCIMAGKKKWKRSLWLSYGSSDQNWIERLSRNSLTIKRGCSVKSERVDEVQKEVFSSTK